MSIVNATLQYMKTSDGQRLYYQKWMPEDPKAIIIFVHGLSEHSGRYEAFTRFFVANNYGVCLFDLRGHGKSDGRRTHINRFYDYLYDTSQFIEFIKKRSPQAPIFLVGHSMGGQIVLNFIVRYSKGVRGIVVLSPHIESMTQIPSWKWKAGKMLASCLPSIRVRSKVNPEDLSHDQKVVENYKTDPNVTRDITLRLGYEIKNNAELVMAMAGRIHLPVLMMHGSADKICSPDATKRFFMRVPVYNKELKIYSGMYHELLNDTDKYQVMKDMEKWLDEQCATDVGIAHRSRRCDLADISV